MNSLSTKSHQPMKSNMIRMISTNNNLSNNMVNTINIRSRSMIVTKKLKSRAKIRKSTMTLIKTKVKIRIKRLSNLSKLHMTNT